MHEPEALAHPVGDREPRDRFAVADRHDLEPEYAVQALRLRNDVLAADVRHPYRQMITSSPGSAANSAATWTARRSSAARWLT